MDPSAQPTQLIQLVQLVRVVGPVSDSPNVKVNQRPALVQPWKRLHESNHRPPPWTSHHPSQGPHLTPLSSSLSLCPYISSVGYPHAQGRRRRKKGKRRRGGEEIFGMKLDTERDIFPSFSPLKHSRSLSELSLTKKRRGGEICGMELNKARDTSPSHSSPLKRRRPSSELSLSLRLSPSPSPPLVCDPPPTTLHPEERGVRLIKLLLACAAATAATDLPRADALLSLATALSSPHGDSLQRLSAALAAALARRLLRPRLPGLLSALQATSTSSSSYIPSPAASLAFARALPYVPFAHAAAARALLRAAAGERVVHVLELGATHASADLWNPILKSLSRLPGSPPHLKLTCVSSDPHVLHYLSSVLTKEAELLNFPFQFHPVRSVLTRLDPACLRVRSGEALAVVSILGLHHLLTEDEKPHGNRGTSADEFLASLRAMRPKVVVLAEQEANHNSNQLVDRFMEALHHYGAMYDSVEAAMQAGAMREEEREAVEGVIGVEAENVVGCEGEERTETHEPAARWAGRMARAGFRQGMVCCEEANRVAESWPGGGCGGGYRVVAEKGWLMICWHDRPLYAVSAWQS